MSENDCRLRAAFLFTAEYTMTNMLIYSQGFEKEAQKVAP